MNNPARTLRQAVRALARSPLFTLVATLTLAVGIGANVAVWSVVDAILLEPLPFREPDRLVGVWHDAPGLGWEKANQAPALYYTYRDLTETFEEMGMWDTEGVALTGGGDPERLLGMRVTDGTLPLLGVRPLHGRLFSAEDDTADAAETVLLSHGLFSRRFGADPAVVGQTIDIDGTPREIIGVLPADLDFLDYDPAIFLPFQFDRAELWFGNFSYQGIGRLAPGVTLEQASADIARMIPIALDSFPMPPGFTKAMAEEVGLAPHLVPLKEDVVGSIGNVLWLILATVGLVLLVACANLANLLLVRSEERQREVAVRAALGAGRRGLSAQVVAESTILAGFGGLLGMAFAWLAIRLLVHLAPQGLPRLDAIGIDGSVALYALLITAAAGALFTILPLLRLGRIDVTGALKEGTGGSGGSRRRSRVHNALVCCQVGVALTLLIASGLMIRSLWSLSTTHPGFERPEEVLTLRIAVPTAEIEASSAVLTAYREMLRRVGDVAGVDRVALSSSITMDGWDSNDPIFVEDFPGPVDQIPPLRRIKWVAPGYFSTMENPVLAGRDLTWDDIEQRRPVTMVTASFATRFWNQPSEAVGRRIRMTPDMPWYEIIGVVGDVRDDGLTAPPTDIVFWPLAMDQLWDQEDFVQRSVAFAVRSPRAGDGGFLEDVRAAIWSVNGSLPLARVRTLDAILTRSLARTSFTLVMLAIAAGAVVLLGAIGIYGVTSYAVSQRRREIGVRMAFGAAPAQVRSLIVRHGMMLAAIGVVLGLVGAVFLTRAMTALLFGVGALDPVTYALAALAVALLVVVASYLPARRAAAVDPMETLRAEA